MPTNNHNLETPSHGEYENTWHVPLNENWNTIDRKLWIADEISELSSYEPHENCAFLATDTYDLYFGDGGSWTEQGTLFEFTQDDLDDLQSQINANANDPHGNDAHSETFAIDGDSQPPTPHGNDAHSEDFAIDGDEQPAEIHAIAGSRHTGDSFSSLNALVIDEELATESYVDSNVIEDHGNESHTEDFATSSETFSGSYTDLSDVPTEFTPETHGDAAHNATYVDTTTSQTITGEKTFDTGPVMGNSRIRWANDSSGGSFWEPVMHWEDQATDGTTFMFYHNDGAVYFRDGNDNQFLRMRDDQIVDTPNADLWERGSRVATRDYMETSGSAKFWDGYEIVFDTETPETNQYIRIETQ